MPEGTPVVRGYDFNAGVDYAKMLAAFATTGFQVRAGRHARARARAGPMLPARSRVGRVSSMFRQPPPPFLHTPRYSPYRCACLSLCRAVSIHCAEGEGGRGKET